jgi:hypothetical protein
MKYNHLREECESSKEEKEEEICIRKQESFFTGKFWVHQGRTKCWIMEATMVDILVVVLRY